MSGLRLSAYSAAVPRRVHKVEHIDVPIYVNDKNEKQLTLWYLNVAASVIHCCSFIAALIMSIVYAPQSFQAELTTDFRYHNGFTFQTQLQSLGSYSLIWVDLPFPAVTAIFHAVIAFSPSVWTYYVERILTVKTRTSPSILRWLEYSITASLMTWVILQLAGVTNILTLIVVGVLANIALQWQGYLQEHLKRKSWVPTIIGWIIFTGQWIIILTYFFNTISSSGAPWFVYTIVIGLFVMFLIFGLIQLTHMMKWPAFMASSYAQEIAYLIMSLTSKLFLTWNLLIGIAVTPI